MPEIGGKAFFSVASTNTFPKAPFPNRSLPENFSSKRLDSESECFSYTFLLATMFTACALTQNCRASYELSEANSVAPLIFSQDLWRVSESVSWSCRRWSAQTTMALIKSESTDKALTASKVIFKALLHFSYPQSFKALSPPLTILPPSEKSLPVHPPMVLHSVWRTS